jgi:hypothetical protein
MFHHGHLLKNEYHFASYSHVKVTTSSESNNKKGSSTVSLTSHKLYLDFDKQDEKNNQDRLIKIDINDITEVRTDEDKKVKLKCRLHHEQLSTYRCIVQKETIFELKNIDKNFEELIGRIRTLNRVRISDDDEFVSQLDKMIQKHEQSEIQSVTRRLHKQQRNVNVKATVFNVNIYTRERGYLLLSDHSVLFHSFLGSDYSFSISSSDVIRMVKKPWRLHRTALEIFLEDKSYFFAFESVQERNVFYDLLIKIPAIAQSQLTIEDYTSKWNDYLISNFEYLMILNDFAGRTLHDTAQYPVYPWIVQQYDSQSIDLIADTTYRELDLPIKAIDSNRLQTIEEEEKKSGVLKVHFSDPSNIERLLYRKYPRLYTPPLASKDSTPQSTKSGGFTSVDQEWKNAKSSINNFSEVIPEFYSGMGIFLEADNDNVKLPPWASSPYEFVLYSRAALEGKIVDKKIHIWIDLIFGDGQNRGNNIFHPSSFEYTDNNLKSVYPNAEEIIASTPEKIFNSSHPERKAPKDSVIIDIAKKRYQIEIDQLKLSHAEERRKLLSEVELLKRSSHRPRSDSDVSRLPSPSVLQGRMLKLEEQLYENETKMRVIQQLAEDDSNKKEELINDLKGVIAALEDRVVELSDSELQHKIKKLESSLEQTGSLVDQRDSEIRKLKSEKAETAIKKSAENEVEADKDELIENQRQEIVVLSEQVDVLKETIGDMHEKKRSSDAIKSSLRTYSPHGKLANWESMFSELTAKYDQLYKSYKSVSEERNSLRAKNRDMTTTLNTTEKVMEREVSSLENKLQQTIREKMEIYDKELEISNKYSLLLQENRQHKINQHFLEQKIKDENYVREKTVNLLMNAESKLPSNYLYTNAQGENHRPTSNDDPMNIPEYDRTPAFVRHRPSSPVSKNSSPRHSLERPSSPTSNNNNNKTFNVSRSPSRLTRSSSPSTSPTSPRSTISSGILGSKSTSPRKTTTVSPRRVTTSPRTTAPSPAKNTSPRKGGASSPAKKKAPSISIPQPNQIKKGVITTPTRTIKISSTSSSPSPVTPVESSDSTTEVKLDNFDNELY